jgi:CheY-like chemotaxis protein
MEEGEPLVMVVDDDEHCREIVGEFLALWGCRVDLAANGKEALECLRDPSRQRPRVILLDLMMPEMGGWDFRLEQIRDPDLVGIPVVIISAANEYLCGANTLPTPVEHMSKPLEFDRLTAVVERYCS